MYHLQLPIAVVISGDSFLMCFKRFIFDVPFMKYTTSVISILLVVVTLEQPSRINNYTRNSGSPSNHISHNS